MAGPGNIATKVTASAKDAQAGVSKLKKFVTKQLADVGEGIAMTHSRVEQVERAVGIEDQESSNAEGQGKGGITGQIQTLSAQLDALREEQIGLKQTDTDMKALLTESLDTLRSSEIPEAASSACTALRTEMAASLRKAWQEDRPVSQR